MVRRQTNLPRRNLQEVEIATKIDFTFFACMSIDGK